MSQRRAGIIAFKINGTLYDVKGSVTYGLGKETREAIVGHDRVHGFKSMPTVPFAECEFSDSADLSLDALAAMEDVSIAIELNNGKVFALREAWMTNSDGLSVGTEEGNVAVRFEGKSAEEITA